MGRGIRKKEKRNCWTDKKIKVLFPFFPFLSKVLFSFFFLVLFPFMYFREEGTTFSIVLKAGIKKKKQPP